MGDEAEKKKNTDRTENQQHRENEETKRDSQPTWFSGIFLTLDVIQRTCLVHCLLEIST